MAKRKKNFDFKTQNLLNKANNQIETLNGLLFNPNLSTDEKNVIQVARTELRTAIKSLKTKFYAERKVKMIELAENLAKELNDYPIATISKD